MLSASIQRRPGLMLALGLCVIGGAVTLLGHLFVGPVVQPARVPLANVAGTETCPSFSPNGRHLAYSGRGASSVNEEDFHIWVRVLPNGVPQQMTSGPGSDFCPVWSPDGTSLAFLRLVDGAARYLVIPSGAPAGPASEKKVVETKAFQEDAPEYAALAWMRQGKSLALVRAETGQPSAIFEVALEDGSARRITSPPAGSKGDFNPAVSPDGQTLAFVRGAGGEARDIWLCNLDGGNPRQLTFEASPIRGVAWTADGKDLIYASNRVRGWQLFRVAASGGSPRLVAVGVKEASNPAIALSGRRLAYTETPSKSAIWLAALPAGDTPPHAILRSDDGREADPSWSPDGRQIAWISDQTGSDEIWVSDAKGDGRRQITNLKRGALTRPRWSPDGRKLLFATRSMPESVYAVSPAARMAQPKPQPLAFGANVTDLTWAHDGQSVYGESRGRIYKIGFGNKVQPQQLTQQLGARQPAESPDGKYVYYLFRRSIWRVPAGGGAEEQVCEADGWLSSMELAAKGIYYLAWEGRRRASIRFYDFASRKSTEVLSLSDGETPRDATFEVSPDGRYFLYPKIDRAETNLVLVENFR